MANPAPDGSSQPSEQKRERERELRDMLRGSGTTRRHIREIFLSDSELNEMKDQDEKENAK
jgi:hypothetical protein